MCGNSGLADCTRHTDDIWTMSRYDESSKECEKRKEDMLHIASNHRESGEKIKSKRFVDRIFICEMINIVYNSDQIYYWFL
jgi:hypothetical protein